MIEDVRPGRSGDELPTSVTMPLLTRITQQSLDGDYRMAADRRGAGATSSGPTPARSRRVLTVLAVLAFGLLVSMAGVQTARDQETTEAGRQVLISRIEDRQDAAADRQQRIEDLSEDNTTANSTYAELGRQLDAQQQRLRQLADETGFSAVSGQGVRVTVDDPPGAAPADQVQDRDLAELINGLWQAGASAISVDGHRVTALSAVRNSGPVIRINGVSLDAPYEVLALGDTRTLQAEFAQTDSGVTFNSVTSQLGMPVSMENAEDLDIPAAPDSMASLNYAKPITTPEDPQKREN